MIFLSCKIEGKTLYDFDPQTGTLQISVDPWAVDTLLEKLGDISNGIDFTLPNPYQVGLKFKGVKEIKVFPEDLETGEYLLTSLAYQSKLSKLGFFNNDYTT